MDIEIIEKSKEKSNNISLSHLEKQKLRVAAYARVSTDHEDQENSYDSQILYYRRKIENHPNWTLVNVYSDEGISGKSIEKRKGFQKMIDDAKNNKIDLILTKSISRFARNTLHTLTYVRMLKEKRIGVIFEEEHINTLDMQGELLLTILSSIAQQEIQNLSNHVRLGIKMKMKQGKLVGRPNPYGYIYDTNTKQLVINEEQARVVRKIFRLAIEGKNETEIAKILTEDKEVTDQGKVNWSDSYVFNVLRNEKYVGDLVQGRYYKKDNSIFLEHKKQVRNNGERELYYVKDHHEAIISREDFELVKKIKHQRMLEKEQRIMLNKKKAEESKYRVEVNDEHFLAKTFFCGSCGDFYMQVKNKRKNVRRYGCKSRKLRHNPICVRTKEINIDMIADIFFEMLEILKERLKNKNTYSKEINKKLNYLKNIIFENNLEYTKENFKSLYSQLINYCIIGGFNEKNEFDPYMVKIILRRNKYLTNRTLLVPDYILSQSSLAKHKNPFTVFDDYLKTMVICYQKNEEGKVKKHILEKVRLIVEFEEKPFEKELEDKENGN